MTMDLLQDIMLFFGGLGMFIYGMQIMAEGLQNSAGSKTRKLLGLLTNNRLLGVLVGALITAIIQSSSATTVMVVGFVNAQIMNLSQAMGVIMGANIGTTMTAWLVSMSEWGSLLKPDFFAPILLVVGVGMMLFSKKEKVKDGANILVGFGILFLGLSTMSGSIEPYADSPIFSQAFTVIGNNPILGLLVGAGVTGIIQSSSASMGILQALAMNGIVGLETSLGLGVTNLVKTGKLTMTQLIEKMSVNPAKIINLDKGSLSVGKAADIVVFDADNEYTVDINEFASKNNNCPYDGMKLYGRVDFTILDGNVVFER